MQRGSSCNFTRAFQNGRLIMAANFLKVEKRHFMLNCLKCLHHLKAKENENKTSEIRE